jgi:hypothetical protein
MFHKTSLGFQNLVTRHERQARKCCTNLIGGVKRFV